MKITPATTDLLYYGHQIVVLKVSVIVEVDCTLVKISGKWARKWNKRNVQTDITHKSKAKHFLDKKIWKKSHADVYNNDYNVKRTGLYIISGLNLKTPCEMIYF